MNNMEKFFCGDDLLDRGKYAQNLKKIINSCNSFPKSNDNESFVIGIDSPWGSGKTFFIKMFENYLNGSWINPNINETDIEKAKKDTGAESPCIDDKIEVIYYDAWENDFWDNAFEPLFDRLIQSEEIVTEAEKKDIAKLGKSAAKIIALAIKGIIVKKIEDQIDGSTIDEILEEAKSFGENIVSFDYQTSELFPEYSKFRAAIELLQQYLRQVVECNNGKLVIIIDELDRCKPVFAIQTLEIIKHLFNVNGLIFVFALDVSQLAYCVKNVYGAEIDAVGYLERFFNYLTMLPTAELSSIIEYYCGEFKLDVCDEAIKDKIKDIARIFALSLRDLRTIFCSFYILQHTTLLAYKNIPNAQIMYFYFLAMKYKMPNMLKDAVLKNDYNEIEVFFRKNPIPFIGDAIEKYVYILTPMINNDVIGNILFNIVSFNKLDTKYKYNVKRCYENVLVFSNGHEMKLSDEHNLSFLLYHPDLLNWNNINKYTLIEYFYRQIEQCDFIHND